MRKIVFKVVAGFVLLNTIGCSTNSSTHINVPVISLSDRQENNFDNVDIMFIRLETTNNNLIGKIDQIQEHKGHVLILETSNRGGVFDFDLNGNYTTKIGDMGRGPGEYIMPVSFSLSSEGEIITIIDDVSNKMLSYNLSKSDFMGSSDTPVNGTSFERLPRNHTFWNIDEYRDGEISNYNYAIFDAENRSSAMFLEKKIKSGYLTGPSKMMYKVGDTLRAYCQFDPYVYQLNNTLLSESYCFEMDGLQFPPKEFLQQISAGNKDYYDDLINSGYISYHGVFENNKNVCINYIANGIKYMGLHNKSNGETICGTFEQIEDGLGIKGLTYLAGTIGDYFVIPLFVERLKDYQASGHAYPEDLTKILNYAHGGENPILLLFKLS